MKNQHLGSSFDDFLKEEGTLAEIEATAVKRVIAFQIEQMMKEEHLSKTALVKKMDINRSVLDKLLDPTNASITLQTLERSALTLGKRLRIELA